MNFIKFQGGEMFRTFGPEFLFVIRISRFKVEGRDSNKIGKYIFRDR